MSGRQEVDSQPPTRTLQGGDIFWVGEGWGGGRITSHGETGGKLINDGESTALPVVCLLYSPTSCFFLNNSFRVKTDEAVRF